MQKRLLSEDEIRTMQNTDIRTVDKNTLIDLNSVEIDEKQPLEERMTSFVRQVQNPNCLRVGDVAVKVVYKEKGPTFQQNVEDLLKNL